MIGNVWNRVGGWFYSMSDFFADNGYRRLCYWTYKVYDLMDEVHWALTKEQRR